MQAIHKEKAESKTVSALINVFKKEKEYCTEVYFTYQSLTNELKSSGIVSVHLVATSFNALTNLDRDIEQMKKYGIWNESQMLINLKSRDSGADAANMVFQECRKHILKTINRDLSSIRSDEIVKLDKHTFQDPVKYLAYRLNTKDGLIYASNSDQVSSCRNLKIHRPMTIVSILNLNLK